MRKLPAWPRHATMVVVCVLMLVPFYWVLKTSLTGENIYEYPPSIIPRTRISSTTSMSGT
jgi:ABC-type glycerol-3-phosphate transport system permease component